MSYYIEVPDGHKKALQLEALYGAEILKEAPLWGDHPNKAIICVVDNGPFEAAAFCYSPQELTYFKQDSSGRPRTWLVMDYQKACELTGYTP